MSIQQIIEERTGYNAASDSFSGFEVETDPGNDRRSDLGEPLLSLVIRDESDSVVTVPMNVHIRFYNSSMSQLILKGNNAISLNGCRVDDEILTEGKTVIFLKNDISSQVETGTDPITPNGQCWINKLNLQKTRLVARGSQDLPLIIGVNAGDMVVTDGSLLEWHHVLYQGSTSEWQFDDSIGRFRSCEFENGGRGERSKLFFTDCEHYGGRLGVHLKDHSFLQSTRTLFHGPRGGGISPVDWEGIHIETYSQAIISSCNRLISPQHRILKISAREKSHISGRELLIEQPPEGTWCVLAEDHSSIELSSNREYADRIYSPGQAGSSRTPDGVNAVVKIAEFSKFTINGYEEIYSDEPGALPAVRMTGESEFTAENMSKIWSYFNTAFFIVGGGKVTCEDFDKGISGAGFGVSMTGGVEALFQNFGLYITSKDEAIKATGGGSVTIFNVPKIESTAKPAVFLSGGVKFLARDISTHITAGEECILATGGGIIDIENVGKIETSAGQKSCIEATGATVRLVNIAALNSLFGTAIEVSSCNILVDTCKIIAGGPALHMVGCRATTRNNIKFTAGWQAIHGSNSTLDSNGDLDFESLGKECILLESTPARIVRAGDIVGFLQGIKAEPNAGLYVNGGDLRPTKIQGLFAPAVRVSGGTAKIYNCNEIKGGFIGVEFLSMTEAELGKNTLIKAFGQPGVSLEDCDLVYIFSDDTILSDADEAIKAVNSKRVKIEACGSLDGQTNGITSENSEIEIKYISNRIFGYQEAGVAATNSLIESFKAVKVEGGFYGIRAISSHIKFLQSDRIIGFGLDGVHLSGGSPGIIEQSARVEGGENGFKVLQSSCRISDIGSIIGAIDGIVSDGSTVRGVNIGYVFGGVDGLSMTEGVARFSNVGQFVGGVAGVSLTGTSPASFGKIGQIEGGAFGITATGVNPLHVHEAPLVAGAVAVNLADSTVEEFDRATLLGGIALASSNSHMNSEYVDYLGIVTLLGSEWNASHGYVLGVFTATDSRVFNRDFSYLAIFTIVNTDAEHSGTSFVSIVTVTDSNFHARGSTLAAIFTAVSSDVDVKRTTFAAIVTLVLSTFEADVVTIGGILTATSSSVHIDSTTIAGVTAIALGSISFQSSLLSLLSVTFGSAAGITSVAGLVVLAGASGDFVECTIGFQIVISGGSTCVGGESGLLTVAGASAVSVSCSGTILGGPVPMSGTRGRTVHVCSQHYEVGSLLANKAFAGTKIEGMSLAGSIQWYSLRSVWLQAIQSVHSKVVAGLATHDRFMTAPPPIPV